MRSALESVAGGKAERSFAADRAGVKAVMNEVLAPVLPRGAEFKVYAAGRGELEEELGLL